MIDYKYLDIVYIYPYFYIYSIISGVGIVNRKNINILFCNCKLTASAVPLKGGSV